jgi:O-antigen ligase
MAVTFSIPFGYEYSRKINTIILILWFFVVKQEELIAMLKNKIIIILFTFIFVHYITLYWSEHIYEGLDTINDLWQFILIPIILYSTIIKKQHIPYIINTFIISMFINEIISYLIYFDLYSTAFSITRNYPVGFINHIQYSVLVAFSSILILYQALSMKNKYIKIIYIIFFITMTTNLVISGGRTGYIVYFVSLIILLFIYYKFSIKNLLQVLVFPTIIFYLAYISNSHVRDRINSSYDDIEYISKDKNYNTSIGTRIAFYPIVFDILSQENNSFFYGVGMGDLSYELEESIKRTGLINTIYKHVHSSYLTAYLNTGILGLILFLLLFIYLFKITTKNKDLKFIQYLFILNFSIGIIPDILFTQRIMMVYFSVFIGIILANELYENKKDM